VNNDGLPDLAVMGSNGTQRLALYINNKAKDPKDWTFIEPLGASRGLDSGSLAFGNFDGDGPGATGDLDLVAAGFDGTATRLYVLENLEYSDVSNNPNSAPAAPTNLTATANATHLRLSWNAPSDDTTGANGFTYQVQVATQDFSLNPATYAISGAY